MRFSESCGYAALSAVRLGLTGLSILPDEAHAPTASTAAEEETQPRIDPAMLPVRPNLSALDGVSAVAGEWYLKQFLILDVVRFG